MNRKSRGRSRCRRSASTNSYQSLEPRRLLAGISLQNINGFETVLIDGSQQADTAVVENSGSSSIRVTLNGEQQTFARSEVERIRFLGRHGDDSFTNNTDISSAAYGHSGNDTLRGGDGNNWIQGGDGNDVIWGGPRNDRLRGRSGDDIIYPAERHDRVFGGDGNDTIHASPGRDYIDGEAGSDQLAGGNGMDEIFGGAGNDVINGGNDNDSIVGGSGNDSIDFGSGNSEYAIFSGDFGDYSIAASGSTLTITSQSASDGRDTIVNGETLRFDNVDRDAEVFQVNLNAAEERSLELINQLRSSRGLNTLTVVSDLSDYAEHWSRNVLPDSFRHSTADEIEHLVIDGRTYYGENIVFVGDASLSSNEAAELFHDTWVDSPSHFNNMIHTRWTEIGIGLVWTSGGWYGTHSFGDS